MALVSFARSSIARLALLHGVLLATSMMAVLGGVYLGTSRLIAAEEDQLIALEAQGLAEEYRDRDLDSFVTAVVAIPGGDTRITETNDTRVPQQTGEPPGGLNQTPGIDPSGNVPGSADPGLPPGNVTPPETGPLT